VTISKHITYYSPWGRAEQICEIEPCEPSQEPKYCLILQEQSIIMKLMIHSWIIVV